LGNESGSGIQFVALHLCFGMQMIALCRTADRAAVSMIWIFSAQIIGLVKT